jgi:carbonic anhydrase/SulP family sulfate permease
VWVIGPTHLVQVPVAQSLRDLGGFLTFPDFSQWMNMAVYTSGLTIALVASLETLLNLEAVDKIDPRQRTSPSSRELWAQGIGNITSGLVGGLPVTSVIVRSSVNINAGSRTKLSAVFHGVLLLVSVVMLPTYLNLIPLSCLAAILIVTGMKLASPALVKQMWTDGRYQFTPFAVTVIAIVMTDLLVGILIGLAVSVSFILNSNLRRPIRRFNERHLGGNVMHIELANQVSFLNRAALSKALDSVPKGGRVLLDAQSTDYIDPDVLDLIRHYRDITAPARGVQLSMLGFRSKYQLDDHIQYVDYSTRELQNAVTPAQVLQILKDGHKRFRSGQRLTRDLGRLVNATAAGQHPLAVILSCIDSRAPVELLFDCGVGDIFTVRVAGNTLSPKVLGSMEYGCAVAGAKLILVLGHTRCGAVSTAVRAACTQESMNQKTGCGHIEHILEDIQDAVDPEECRRRMRGTPEEQEQYIDEVARENVRRTIDAIEQQSDALRKLVNEGRIAIVGAVYDVAGGDIAYIVNDSPGMQSITASWQTTEAK